MKKLHYLIAALILICCSAYSANRVYILEREKYGIVANDIDWICTIEKSDPNIDSWLSGYYIKGKSKKLPIEFYFFHYGMSVEAEDIKYLLLQRAYEANSVFSNVRIRDDLQKPFVCDGEYFDNNSSGFFAIFILPDKVKYNSRIAMFVSVQDILLSEQTRENLYQKAFALITPLVNSK